MLFAQNHTNLWDGFASNQSFKHHLVASAMKVPSLFCITLIYFKLSTIHKKQEILLYFLLMYFGGDYFKLIVILKTP